VRERERRKVREREREREVREREREGGREISCFWAQHYTFAFFYFMSFVEAYNH
jgi:hypothetical protein